MVTICIFRSSGGGELDVMVLMSSYVACCVVQVDWRSVCYDMQVQYQVGRQGSI